MRETFRVGDWRVHPDSNEIVRGDTRVHLEPKVMELLAFLSERQETVLSRREILDAVWAGTFVGDEALTYAMTELRRALEDDAKDPKFIQTISRRGYRLIAPVSRPSAAPGSAKARPAGRRLLWIAGAVVVVAAAAAWLWWRAPTLPFGAGDRVLVARFENRTGEAIFDSMLEYWLEQELGNSRFVRVVSRERIEDSLRLMKRPADTVVDRALGREVCLRDGEVRGLVAGRADKIGSRYVLRADLVDPTSGEVVASRAEEATGDNDVLPAMGRLSGWLRETLGEKLAAIRAGEKLERVTTPSLRALQLFTRAERLVRADHDEAAAEILKQCIAEDPGFASAHLFLAWSLYRQNRTSRQHLVPVRRAVELAGSASERERYFILGSYYTMLGELEKSIAPYEALRAIDPEHYWGIGNLAHAYSRYGRAAEAESCWITLANARPSYAYAQYMAASAIIGANGDLARARPYIDRAVRATTENDERSSPWLPWFLKNYSAWSQFAVGDPCGGLREWERNGLPDECATYTMAGKLRAAEECAERQGTQDRYRALAALALLKDDQAGFREAVSRLAPPPAGSSDMNTIVFFIRAGFLEKARKAMEVFASTRSFHRIGLSGGSLRIFEGELARTSGDRSKAIRLMREGMAVPSFDGSRGATYFLGAESLAELLHAEGRAQEALEPLLAASRQRLSSSFRGGLAFWMRNQKRLADLYRELGRAADAERVEAERRRYLACADEDHPILVALRETAAKRPISAAQASKL